MNRLFLGMTLGGDPHTLGIYSAGTIARLMNIKFHCISPDSTLEQKIELIAKYNPRYLGLSYRLSSECAIKELLFFLKEMEKRGLFAERYANRRMCFAGLPETLQIARSLQEVQKYRIHLMGQSAEWMKTDLETIKFFEPVSDRQVKMILEKRRIEKEPERMEVLDQIAKDIISEKKYWEIKPFSKPSIAAIKSLKVRRNEVQRPLIRTHFGIPAKTITPTVDGIRELAAAGVVDEISLGSSDLSQRFFGDVSKFEEQKNDGGVPYKTKADLEQFAKAAKCGNYPSLKPYCHVNNMITFADQCVQSGLLTGAHQAVPLFWFSQLDGRGPLSVDEAVEEHILLVKHLAALGIPVEMNDPNQWSSRFVHDALFVADYALIASVMYCAGVKDMVFQFQFNKPAVTGDYADIAKMCAAKKLVSHVIPSDVQRTIFVQTRSGIEHFSTNMDYAKYQLARSTLLQMLIYPDIIHLVSYCEADHAAYPADIIESSKIVQAAIGYFKYYEYDIRKNAEHPFVKERTKYLWEEAEYVVRKIADLAGPEKTEKLYQNLSNPVALRFAMKKHYMTAPGIMNLDYKNNRIITKTGAYGVIDSYETWESSTPMSEKIRIDREDKRYEKTISGITFK